MNTNVITKLGKRQYRPLIGGWIYGCSLWLLLATAIVRADNIPNHYVVLFDGSGSMLTDFDGTYWPKTSGFNSKENDAQIAKKIHKLLEKVFQTNRNLIPPVQPHDYFSFVLFSIGFNQPIYDINKMFGSNQTLIFGQGLPEWQSFTRVDNSKRFNGRGNSIASGFGGHSPIVAATAGVLPYLRQEINQRQVDHHLQQVGKIFLIRITDGKYNSGPNGADEYVTIINTASIQPGTTASLAQLHENSRYDQYQVLNQKVNAAFDTSVARKDCVITTQNGELGFMNCANDAYQAITGKGQGFLVSYMEVKPRGQALNTLTSVEKTVLALVPEKQNESLIYSAHNRIIATGKTDDTGETLLKGVQWMVKGKEKMLAYQPCKVENQFVSCQQGDKTIVEADAQGQLPTGARYSFEYHRQYKDIYPFTYVLPIYDIDVEFNRMALTEQTNRFYNLPRNPDDLTLAFLDPRRLFRFHVAEPSYSAISDQLFMAHSKRLQAATLTEFTRQMENDKIKFMAQEQHFNAYAKIIYLSLFVLLFALYWFWPRRQLLVEDKLYADSQFLLDFNQREGLFINLVAALTIRNIAKTRNQRPMPLSVQLLETQVVATDRQEVATNIAILDNVKTSLVLTARPHAPFALTPPAGVVLTNQEAFTGQEYFVYFNANDIEDVEITPTQESYFISLQTLVNIDAAAAGSQNQTITLDLQLKPEKANLIIDRSKAKGLNSQDSDLLLEFEAHQRQQTLLVYELVNDTRYHFSHVATGQVRVEIKSDTDDRGYKKAISVINTDTEQRGQMVDFHLTHQQQVKLAVLLDHTQLHNPVDIDSYQILVSTRTTDGPWQTEEYVCHIKRNSDRTDVVMKVSAVDVNHGSIILDESNAKGLNPFILTKEQQPIKVQIEPSSGDEETVLANVSLQNSCIHGRGFATWQAVVLIDDSVINQNNIKFAQNPLDALYLVDQNGRKVVEGTLNDNLDEQLRNAELTCVLNHAGFKPQRRTMPFAFSIRIHWQLFLDGDDTQKADIKTFETEITCQCVLLHEPPRRALAIDSGTSGYAIAFAAGPKGIEILNLQAQAERNITNGSDYRFQLDNNDQKSPFLNSECSILLNNNELKTLTANNADFITLPRDRTAISDQPEKVFVGIKALLAAGYDKLPIKSGLVAYLGENGPTTEPPPLTSVMEGIYKGIRERFVDKILADKGVGFSHMYFTHPNTYTQNHVNLLREIVENAFLGYESPYGDRVYPENIHFFSESDAVAFYYMLNAKATHKNDWANVPAVENVFVYDIGAGTLDMTYLQIHWLTNQVGSKTPTKVEVLQRGGVSKAGNFLDECIARDLHEFLKANLDSNTQYTQPIVVDDLQTMDLQSRFEFNELRERIQQLKIAVSKGEELKLPLLAKTFTYQGLIRNFANLNAKNYGGKEGIYVDENTQVYWNPTIKQLLDGTYVKAFLQQVATDEVTQFFNYKIPHLDTVIISGRTSLWTGFIDRLKKTLGVVETWETFNGNSVSLKKAVALGVLEHAYRWPDLQFIAPKSIGVFGLQFDFDTPGETKFIPYKKSGECQQHYFGNAAMLEIGLKTNNGFISCFSIIPSKFYSSHDKTLEITLNFEHAGELQAVLMNAMGNRKVLNKPVNVSVLQYSSQPWPIGAAKLQYQQPKELMKGK